MSTHGVARGGVSTFVRLFMPQFAQLVESGDKLQTVRPTPKRMPKPGDKISLRMWTGKPRRSRQRVLREATITAVLPCMIDETGIMVDEHVEEPDSFALRDGFADWTELREWFREKHGLPFVGIVIHWLNVGREQSAPGADQQHK